MADIDLTVKLTPQVDVSEIQKAVSSALQSINANPPKIKILFDDSQLKSQINNIRSQIQALNNIKIAPGTGTGSTRNTASNTLKQDTIAYNNALNKVNKSLAEVYRNSRNWTAAQKGSSSASFETYKQQATELENLKAQLQTGAMSVSDFNNAYSKIVTTMTSAASGIKIAGENMKAASNEQTVLANGTKEYYDALSKLSKLQATVNSNTGKWSAARNGKSSDSYNEYVKQGQAIQELINKLEAGKLTVGEFKTKLAEIQSTMSTNAGVIKSYGENTRSIFDSIGTSFKRFAQYFSMSRIIFASIQKIKEMARASIEVESAMNRIQIVTGASDKQIGQFFETTTQQAKELGQSITDVAASIETFSRLGYNLEDSSQLSKYANIMANVGGTDVDAATTGITSIIKGYGLDVSEAEHVSDVLIDVGQKYAISASELMEAFERGGASMAASNTSFEKSAALFAATNASLQNAAKTGTLWNTVSARIRSATKELEEMGESTEDMAGGFSKYRDELIARTGVDVQDAEGNYRDLYDIFVDIAKVWNNIADDQSRARVGEILGGTRNQAGIMSTIQNISDAIGAYDTAMNSAGAAEEANNKHMETTEAHLGQLKASFQELSTDVFNSDILKGGVDFLRSIVEGIDAISKSIGSVSTILAGGFIVNKILGIVSAIRTLHEMGQAVTLANIFTEAFPAISAATAAMAAAKVQGASMFAVLQAGASSLWASMAPLLLNPATWFVGAGVATAAIVALNDKYKKSLIDTATEATKTWTDTTDDINSTIDKYTELKTLLDSGTLSEEDTISTKQQILDLQNQITSSYGESAKGIDLINGSLDTQLKKLKEITQAQAKENIEDPTNRKAYEDAESEMTRSREYRLSPSRNVGTIRSDKALSDLISNFDDISIGTDINGEFIKFTGNAEDAEDTLKDFISGLRELEEIDPDNQNIQYAIDSATTAYEKNKDVLDEYQENYKSFLEQQLFAEGHDDVLYSYTDALNKYNDALLTGDSSKIEESRKAFEDATKAKDDFLAIDGNDRFANLFDGITKNLDTASIKFNDFKDALGGKTLQEARENLANEQKKIEDWGLSDFGSAYDKSGGSFVQHQFGNVDMDKRTIITWSEKLKQTYADALKSWDYEPETGGIDTVFGGSDRFGKGVLKNGVEIAFTPVMTVDGKTTFLDKSSVYGYIEDLVKESTTNGVFDFSKMLKLDEIGKDGIKGIVAAADQSLNYDNNGNWAETVGRLMHFSGDFGAISLAYKDIEKASQGISDNNQFAEMSDDIRSASDELRDMGLYAVDVKDALMTDGMQKGEDQISTLAKAWGITAKSSESDIQAFCDVLVSAGVVVGEVSGNIKNDSSDLKLLNEQFELSTEYAKTFQTALSESASATGLSSESIKSLKDAYSNLGDFDAEKLFERTANGVHLNREELDRLNAEIQDNTLSKMYDNLRNQQQEYYDAKANGQDTSGIESEIASTQRLISQYQGLTSAYNEWVSAKSGANDRDSYEGIGSGYKEMKETLDQGWYSDDSLNAYLDLVLNAKQRTGDAYADFQKLNEEIAGTSHSIMDYWSFDEESGKLSTDGLFTFLDDVKSKLGEEYVQIDKEGNYAFDFTGDKLQKVADEFGMSTELVEQFAKALNDAGAVSFDSIKLDFDAEVDPLEKVKTGIEELKEQRAEIDIETDPDAAYELDQLISKLERQYYLRINTETNGALDQAVEDVNRVQSIIENAQSENPVITVSAIVDGSEEIQTLAQEIANLPPEVQTSIGVNTENLGSAEGILGQFKNQTINVPINYTAGDQANAEDKEATVNYKKGDQEVPEDKTATVNYAKGTQDMPSDATARVNYVGLKNSLPTLHQTVVVNKVPKASGTFSPTKAYANGSSYNMVNLKQAYADGQVALSQNEVALVNELGTESIIRDGKWYLLPKGMHQQALKKGDIVLSANQTKALLNTGAAPGHGRAYAYGSLSSAFPHGTAKRRRGNSSSGSSSSGSSNTGGNNGGSNKGKKGSSKGGKNDSSSKSLEKFKKWLNKFFDWIEVKLDRLADKTEEWSTAAEKAVEEGSKAQQTYYQNAIKSIGSEINANSKAENKYERFAEKIGKKGAKKAGIKKSDKWVSGIMKKLENGKLDITKYGEKKQTIIKEMQEWYDKSRKSAKAVRELTDEMQELYTKLRDIPNAKAEKAIEKITKSLEDLKRDGERNFKFTDTSYSSYNSNLDQQTAKAKEEKQERDIAKSTTAVNLEKAAKAIGLAGNADSLRNNEKVEIQDNWSTKKKKKYANYNAALDAYNKAFDEQMEAEDEYWSAFYENASKKLENIKNWYDAISSVYTSEAKQFEAFTDLKRFEGVLYEGTEDVFKQQGNALSQNASNALQEYNNYLAKFNEQISNGELLVGTQQYNEALAQLNELKRNYYSSTKELKEFNESLKDLHFDNLENALDRIQSRLDRLKARNDYAEKVGNKRSTLFNIGEDSYAEIINADVDKIELAYKKYNEALAEQRKYTVGSDPWNKYAEKVNNARQEIIGLAGDIEDASDAIRELRWSAFNKGIHTIERIKTELEQVQSLLNEDAFLEKNGTFSREGIANMALYAQMIEENNGLIDVYRKAIGKLNSEYQNNMISYDELIEQTEEYQDQIHSLAEEVDDYRSKILDQYFDSLERQNELLEESIDLRDEALKKLRDYHNYEKTIKEKGKSIAYLEQQIKALNGVSNKAGQAKLASLRNQLAESREDFNEEQWDHELDLRSEGYEKLKDNASRNLDLLTQEIQRNATLQNNIISELLNNIQLSSNSTINFINDKIKSSGLVVSSTTTSVIGNLNNTSTNLGNLGLKYGDVKNATEQFSYANDATNVSVVNTGNAAEAAVGNLDKLKNAYDAVKTSASQATEQIGSLNEAAEKVQQINIPNVNNPNPVPTVVDKIDNVANNDPQNAKTEYKPYTFGLNATEIAGWIQANANTKKKKANIKTDTNKKIYDMTGGYILSDQGLHDLAKKLGVPYDNASANGNIYKMLQQIGIFAKGSRRINKDQLGWTQDAGQELIYRSADGAILTPLGRGDKVFTAEMTENLWNIARSFNRDAINSNLAAGRKFNSITNSPNISLTLESLIHVDGNIDKNATDEMRRIANESVDRLSRQLASDFGMYGHKIKF